MLLLSIGLAGNIFAMGPVTVGVGVVPGLFSFAVEQVFSLIGDENCPLRQCQDCQPNNTDNGGDQTCRPA